MATLAAAHRHTVSLEGSWVHVFFWSLTSGRTRASGGKVRVVAVGILAIKKSMAVQVWTGFPGINKTLATKE